MVIFTLLLLACYRCYDQDDSEAWESRHPIVKSLVEEGKADVNLIKKGTKLTALHWAALNNDPIVVSYLLTKGAKMEYSKQYQTPVDVAGLCANLEVRYLETLKNNYRSWTAY
jgi:ankyrin repeat protein